jgi:recombination protein RecR
VLPARLHRLAVHLARLPGVGEKTAMRFALHLVTADPAFVRALGEELSHLPEAVRPCARCGFLADVVPGEVEPVCSICRDDRRDTSLLCVVARVPDLLAIERSGVMRGRYFVLTRLLSPLDGIGPEDLPLDRLARRIGDDAVKEVILATPPTVDGEATALLLARELKQAGVKVSRIASGVPHGGDLEFADAITLGRSLEGRVGIE